MTKTKSGTRVLSLLLALLMLTGLLPLPANAASIADGSTSCTVALGPGQFYLTTNFGTKLGAWAYTYTTNDGTSGAAFCINHGLHYTSRTLPIAGKYTASPQAAGALANGYPSHSVDTFLGLYLANNPILSGLTESEYAYATQLAIWATLGQLGIAGTQFTSGREFIAEPTGDTQQMRVFRAVQLILDVAKGWTRIPQTGMYIRLDEDSLGGNISVPADMTLEYAANRERYGIKREVIGGVPYYTREYTFASATSTYYSGYHIELWYDNAPEGTMFTDLENHELSRGTFRGNATWRLPVTNKDTSLNSNGFEYSGRAKLCIPAETVPNSGEITIRCGANVMQYEIYLAKNDNTIEQSYIIADPSEGVQSAEAVLMWGGILTETGKLQVTKVSGGGQVLPGAKFTLTGTDGSSRVGTTDENGIVTWDLLDPLISYTLTETEAPAGYAIVDPMSVRIQAARVNYLTVQDGTQKQLTVKKVDAQTGYSLQGATMRFEQIDGSFTTTGYTDPAGIIQMDADQLPVGSYKVYEVTPPEGYELDATPQTVHWDGRRDVTMTFKNVRKPTLVIYKCDEGNNYSLPYASFDVFRNGQRVTSVTTNENGLAYVPGVTTGYYTVKETVAPAGYVLDGTEHSVYVDNYNPATTDDPRITVENRRMPQLRIVKYDAQTKQGLSDTTFAVYRDTALIGEYTTNASGEIFLYDLDPGTYLVKEISTLASHVVNSVPQEIKLEAGAQNQTLVFLNYLKPGIFLTKLDSQTYAPLANARFKISQVGGSFSKEYMTDANGEVNLTALDPGSYTVEELAAPENYLIDDSQRIIKIEGGENAVFTFTDTKKPTLSIVKYDSERSKLLSGATFRVAKIEDGSHYLDRITDMRGEITIENLDPGVYSVQEISAPSGYVKNETEFHVELFAGQTSQLVVTDQEKPDLKIIKRDADTGEALSGAVFKIKKADSSTVTTETTDANGEIFIRHLDPGVYEITEATPPTGYLPAEEPKQLITLEPDKLGTVVFENHLKPNLTVNKIDSITGNGVQGAKFRVTYGSNQTFSGEINDLGYYYSDENGRFRLYDLRDGWYKVQEVEPPVGYTLKAPDTQEFYLLAGTGKTVTFEDTPLSALVVYKYDSVTGEAVEGAVFQVKYLSGASGTGGTVIATQKTSANGSFTVTGLEAGAYVVEELASDSGHVIDTAPQTAYISGDPQAIVQLYFGNAPKGSILVTKKDALTGAPLSDVEFLVTDSTGTLVGNANGKHVTDSAGSIRIDGIAPGVTLIVKETRAKSGYILDDTPQAIQIKSGETVTLEFRNQPKGRLTITKKDAITGAPLAGVTFSVTNSSGEYVANAGGRVSSNGQYTTDAAGQIVLTDLVPDTYVVTELSTISGYVPDSTPHSIVVKAGDSQTLTVANRPKGNLIVQKFDSVTKEPLAGAEFRITMSNGTLADDNEGLTSSNGLYVTDENGQIYLSKLTPATYVITEVTAPDNYKLSSGSKTVFVRAADTQTVSFYDDPLCTLNILKRDAVTKKPLANAEFSVKYSDGTTVGTDNGRYVTGKDGTVTVSGLKPDATVIVAETRAPKGYIKDDAAKSIVVRTGVANALTVDNEPTTTLIIRKYIEGTAYEPLAGVAFKLIDGSGAAVGPDDGVYYTDEAGEIVLDGLEPGSTVTAREIKTVDGFVLNGNPQDILIREGEVQELTFWNQRKGSLTIQKLDSVTKAPLAGVQFKVTYADGRVVDTEDGKLSSNGLYTTDANGRITITGVTGTLVVTETKTITGYTINEGTRTQTVVIKPDDGQTLTFLNDPMQTLTLQKYVTGTTTPIPGVTFHVTDSSGAVVGQTGGDYITDENGRVTISGLVPGTTVTARETKTVSGFVLDSTPKSILIKSGTAQTLTFFNEKKGSLIVKKQDSATGAALAGAEFRITTISGDFVDDNEGQTSTKGVYVTDEHGEIRLLNVEPDTYVITETKAPEGYVLDRESQTVKVNANDAQTVVFTNTAKQSAVIQKYAEGTTTPIPGVTFLVTDASGAPVGSANGEHVTDEAGRIVLTGLTPGMTLIAREIKTSKGYALNGTPQTIVVGSGAASQTVATALSASGNAAATGNTMTFYDEPLCVLVVQKFIEGTTTPIKGVRFLITDSRGAAVGTTDGEYVTDEHGQIVLRDLEPGTTITAKEIRAADGYLLNSEPKSITLKSGDEQTLTFYNSPTQTLTLQKYVTGTTTPIPGVTFLVTDSSGAVVGPNNGEYTTDRNGRVVLSGLTPGMTITAKEVKTASGYVLDTTPQSILIKSGTAQTLTFFNTAEGGLELIKVDAADKGKRIANTTFEIRRMDGGLVDTVTTDKAGRVHVDLGAGDYYAVEIEAAKGYKLDATPTYFTVADGKTTTVTVTNKAMSGILIHKTDSMTGKGIYGVTFLLYDWGNNPIGQYTTDNQGYARIEGIDAGRYKLRELENKGYIPDTELKTVEVKSGETTLIEWKNVPVTAQIQITKKSADYNPTNGLSAGTLLQGAVFEIRDKAGNLVDTIQSDNRGVAASKPLPLGRYTIKEVKAPANYGINENELTAYLEHEGQIVRFEVTDKSLSTGVSITKTGPKEVMAGQPVRYQFSGIANTSNVRLDSFYFRDTLPAEVRLDTVVTGTWNFPGTYKITYRVNGGEPRTLADNLSTSKNYKLAASPVALGLASNERVTEIMFVFGQAPGGFAQVEAPNLYCTAVSNITATAFVNVADVGGVYNGQWIQSVSRWVTSVYGKPVKLPRTGY